MYVVSEITGKRYATVDECIADEELYKKKEREAAEEKFRKAWGDVIKAVENYEKISSEIDPDSTAELKFIIEMMRRAN